MKKIKLYAIALLGGAIKGFLRVMLVPSFLIACIFAPVTMLSGWRDWPHIWRGMWDEPF